MVQIGEAAREVAAHRGEAEPIKTSTFKVVVEPDGERWHACCPALVRQGAAAWRYSKEEALKNIARWTV